MYLKPGEVVDGRFKIEELIGVGGFGAVYRASQGDLGRPVALKIIYAEAENAQPYVERLKREALVLSKLQHRNIVSFFGCGHHDNVPFIALEWVEGRSLGALLKAEGPLSIQTVVAIAKQSCEALAHAHANGSVHRDLKPTNIIIAAEGDVPGEPNIRLVDFGLVKLLPHFGEEVQKLTQTGEALGSIMYMSPEQCMNQEVDAQSDLYSLGVVLYECLAGSTPYRQDSDIAVMQAHVKGMAAPLECREGDSPELFSSVAAIVYKAMAADRDARYQNAQEMLDDLSKVSRGEKLAPRGVLTASRKGSVMLLVAAACSIIICLAGVVWKASTSQKNPSAYQLYRAAELKQHLRDDEPMSDADFGTLEKIVQLGDRDRSFDVRPDEYNLLCDKLIRTYFARGRVVDGVRLFGSDHIQNDYIRSGRPYDSLLGLANQSCKIAVQSKDREKIAFFQAYRKELIDRVQQRSKDGRKAISLVGLAIGIDQLLCAPKDHFEQDLQLLKASAAVGSERQCIFQSMCLVSLAETFYWSFHDDKRAAECSDLAVATATRETQNQDAVARITGMVYWNTRNWRKCVDALSRCRTCSVVERGAVAGALEHLGLADQARPWEEAFLADPNLPALIPAIPGLIFQIKLGMNEHDGAARAAEFGRRLNELAASTKH